MAPPKGRNTSSTSKSKRRTTNSEEGVISEDVPVPTTKGSSVAKHRSSLNKENVPASSGPEPTRRSGRLMTAVRTEKGEALDASIAKDNVRRALATRTNNSAGRSRKRIASAIDGETEDNAQQHSSKRAKVSSRAKAKEVPVIESEDDEDDEDEDGDVRVIPKTRFEIVARQDNRSSDVPPTFTSIATQKVLQSSNRSSSHDHCQHHEAVGENPSDTIHSSTPPLVSDSAPSNGNLHGSQIVVSSHGSRAKKTTRQLQPLSSTILSPNRSQTPGLADSDRYESVPVTAKAKTSRLSQGSNKEPGSDPNRGRSRSPRSAVPRLSVGRDSRSRSPRRSTAVERYPTSRPMRASPTSARLQPSNRRDQDAELLSDDADLLQSQAPSEVSLGGNTDREVGEEGSNEEVGEDESDMGSGKGDVTSDEDMHVHNNELSDADRDADDEETGVEATRPGEKNLAKQAHRRSRRRTLEEKYPKTIKHYYRDEQNKVVPRRNPAYTKGKVNRWQYHPKYRKIFERAWVTFEFLMLMNSVFPRPEQERKMAIKAWMDSCAHFGVDYGFDDFILQNIAQRTWQLRGEMKTVAKTQLAYYGFVDSTSRKVMKKNRKNYRLLNPHDKNDHRIYYNQSIATVLRETLFKKGKVGDHFLAEFRRVPFQSTLIAFAATAIQNVLDEYKKGYWAPIKFSAETYKKVYLQHQETMRKLSHAGPNGDMAMDRLTKHIEHDLYIHLQDLDEWDEDVDAVFDDDKLKLQADAIVGAEESASSVGDSSSGSDSEDESLDGESEIEAVPGKGKGAKSNRMASMLDMSVNLDCLWGGYEGATGRYQQGGMAMATTDLYNTISRPVVSRNPRGAFLMFPL
ncbi:hypothetical protein SISNIDRAFT_469988 [Sistotremastrum niveocremeum HHB9708]|uniref:DUF6532 domain-containing protein n=1 Tax=Sistotremastrum niveocremeum HHB9708 TaxID=1314777 RepID=A0A164PHA9_9AGAM|nr:hypothetical protein SISNIDRAFT_469988 [Sistotremastrum niveocremeum HHB9708]